MTNFMYTMTLEIVKYRRNSLSISETVEKEKKKRPTIIKASSSEQVFQCDQCDYTCENEITLKNTSTQSTKK